MPHPNLEQKHQDESYGWSCVLTSAECFEIVKEQEQKKKQQEKEKTIKKQRDKKKQILEEQQKKAGKKSWVRVEELARKAEEKLE